MRSDNRRRLAGDLVLPANKVKIVGRGSGESERARPIREVIWIGKPRAGDQRLYCKVFTILVVQQQPSGA